MNKRSLQLSGQQDMWSAICPGGRVYVSPVRWTDGQTETEMLLPSFRPMPDTRSSSSAAVSASAPAPGAWIPAPTSFTLPWLLLFSRIAARLTAQLFACIVVVMPESCQRSLTTGYISLCVCVGFYLV